MGSYSSSLLDLLLLYYAGWILFINISKKKIIPSTMAGDSANAIVLLDTVHQISLAWTAVGY